MIDLIAAFEKFDDDFLKFDKIDKKLHARPDVCAFILIDKLLPNDGCDMVEGAEHDKIYLNADCDQLAKIATEEDVLTLVRCGVFFDSATDGLAMFA